MWRGAIAAPSGRQNAGVHRYRRRYDVRRCCFPRRHAEDGHPSAWFCVHRLMAAARLPGARASPCLAALTSDRPLRGHHATICRILPLLNSDLIQLNRLSILSHPRERPNKIFRTPQSVHVCTPPTLTMCQGVRPRGTFFPCPACSSYLRAMAARALAAMQAARRARRSCRTCRGRRRARVARGGSPR